MTREALSWKQQTIDRGRDGRKLLAIFLTITSRSIFRFSKLQTPNSKIRWRNTLKHYLYVSLQAKWSIQIEIRMKEIEVFVKNQNVARCLEDHQRVPSSKCLWFYLYVQLLTYLSSDSSHSLWRVKDRMRDPQRKRTQLSMTASIHSSHLKKLPLFSGDAPIQSIWRQTIQSWAIDRRYSLLDSPSARPLSGKMAWKSLNS